MVTIMNKIGFINKLKEKTNYDEEKCIIINSVLEENFIIGNKNKVKITTQLEEKLNVTSEEAEKIYNIAMEIIGSAIKESIKHPFKSKDN